ncbi:COPS7B [Bugula neritina]|nr:COPS7B [Bugula neritina]
MVKKLRHLSIVSLAAKCKQIPYSLLLKELDMPNVRELEDLIIEAIYAGLIKARMDQNEQKLEVYYAMGRDVEMSKLPELLGILEQWTGKCEESLSDIQAQLLDAQQKKSAHMKLKNQTDTEIINIKKTLALASGAERAGIRPSTETMDTDVKSAKKPAKMKGLRGSASKVFKGSNS